MRRALPLLLAIGAFVVAGLLWIITDPRASEHVYEEFSSANTSDTGLSQAFAYLARRGRTAMLTRPLGRDPIEPGAVVFRITERVEKIFDPEDLRGDELGPPRPRERPLLSDDEDRFVRSGGRVVLAARDGLLPVASADCVALKAFPIWPSLDQLEAGCEGHGFVTLPARMHALFIAGNRVIVARQRIGDGDLLLVSWPEVFQNQYLGEADHLRLLSALAGRRAVYFDEMPHGIVSGDGALSLMKDWNLGPFLLLLAVVALLVFWRGGRRIGPPEDDHRETRSESVDLVRSLAALYDDVTPNGEALSLYHSALTRTLAHTSGLRGDALHRRVGELTDSLRPPRAGETVPDGVFQRMLSRLNDGFLKIRPQPRTPGLTSRAGVKTGARQP